MNIHDLKTTNFKEKFNFIHFPHSFLFSHPKDALNTSRNLILVGHRNITHNQMYHI